MWSRKHQSYLKEYHPTIYNKLILNRTLHQYLTGIDSQAKIRIHILIKKFTKQDGIAEQLKMKNQMEWVSSMDIIRNKVDKIINVDIIFA